MKKITTAILALICSISYAQVNQYDALKNIPEGTILTRHPSPKKGEDGKYTSGTSKEKYKIYHHNSIHGKLYVMSVEKETDSKEKYDFRGPATNHYSQPSIIGGSKDYGRGYVIIGNTIYYLTKIKNWSNPSSFVIDEVYLNRSNGEEKKEKLTMKERMAQAKAKLAEAANGPKEITEVDHKKVLKEYFSAMAKKQSSTSLTAKEKSEEAAIIKAEEDRIAKINARNSEFWNGAEGQAIRDRDAHFAKQEAEGAVLINDLGTTLWVCYGQGAYDDLKPGEKKVFHCSVGGTVYKGTKKEGLANPQYNSSTDMMFKVENNCGKQVKASAVIR